LVSISEHKPLSERALVGRLRQLYHPDAVAEIQEQWALWRKQGSEKAVRADMDRFEQRMGDVSEFIKTLKQRFTQWYNKQQGRRGTLWEDRFKSVLVQGDWLALSTMAAYIDLNAVRAGIVTDPKDYRWCGYGEAVGGSPVARRGLTKILEQYGQRTVWRSVSRVYREHLFGSGIERAGDERGRGRRRGFSRKRVAKVIEEGGDLSRTELLRCRVRYFSDGAVLGSREFVNEVFDKQKGKFFHSDRKEGARTMKGGSWEGLCTVRDLRREVITVPSGGAGEDF
jgi:hypothetical protein